MKIVLLYGGQSAEHDISIISAFNISQEIMLDVYSVLPVYITRKGIWLKGPLMEKPLEDASQLKFEQAFVESWAEQPGDISTGVVINPGDIKDKDMVVFPVLHGPNGEDGTVQGLLEVLNLPYVGAGVTASATGMDKIISKQLFDKAGLPQVPYIAFVKREWLEDQEALIQKIEGSLLYPLFVKPANMGSSVGISRVESSEDLKEAIQTALKFDRRIVIEQGITAYECEVAILGNEDPHASVVGMLVKDSDFYDYDEKYINNTVKMQIPAELDPSVSLTIQDYALKAYQAIDGSGLSRADFFVTANNDVYINELNTMPGFTPYSMYPCLWNETGLSTRDLIEELIQLALKRYEMRQALKNQ
ncbi:D-alanine--D-alanine ligase [Ignavigranum ruoffiae]|uniref:D-alanine--D-alanine ligase n=1 Tax=Ignavigranum ruoffiae TaxID=89093 RepID=UPI003AFFBC98